MSAESYLASLEPFGWNFGLDRIRALVAALGMPQHRFASVHVVGTNGKSSVTLMTAALLERAGIATGAYLSPHPERWSERVRLRGAAIAEPAFDAAMQRVAAAVPAVERRLADDERVTQFEALTAAAFVSFAAAEVQVAVVEAGLGGRLDATNVLPSRVTALTSIALDHTLLLGDTETQIAAEKLAVLRDHAVLVLGEVSAPVRALAERRVADSKARLVEAKTIPEGIAGGLPPYGRRNLGVAVAAAEEITGDLSREGIAEVARSLVLPGRLERLAGKPPLLLDAAHNPAAARALADALELGDDAPLVGCVAVLDDKDSAGICEALAPVLAGMVCTEVPVADLAGLGRPGARSLAAAQLAVTAREAGLSLVEARADPRTALARAAELASARGGTVLVTGSHYLLRYAREGTQARRVGADG
jgi:dihydrofolate synthase/folylpolyglutamate synthase